MIRRIIIMSGFICTCLNGFAAEFPSYPFIHTTGFAYNKFQPDTGEIFFEVIVENQDPDAAFSLASTRITEIQSLMQQTGISEENVTIRDLKKRISKNPAAQEGSELAYELSCEVHIKVRDLSQWKTILLPLMKMQNLDKLMTTFDTSERDKFEAELTRNAINDAQRKATNIANTIGKKLGAATAISDSRIKNIAGAIGLVTSSDPDNDRDIRRQAIGKDLLQIEPVKLQASIDVLYEIKAKTGK